MVIVCAMVKIPLSSYYKWIMPFYLISLLIQTFFIFLAIEINYGPF